MGGWRTLRSWLRTVIMPWRVNREIDDELRFHLEGQIDEYVEQGMGRQQAQERARREFGAVALASDLCRDARRLTIVHDATQDVRYAMRMFARTPAFTVVAALTLALGIGASTAIFSVVNAVLLRPLPFTNPDRVVRIFEHLTGPLGGQLRQGLGREELNQVRSLTRTLSHVDAYGTLIELRLGRDEQLELQGARASYDLLAMLGGRTALGRLFNQRESDAMDPVIVLSHRVWQRQFGGSADVLGRKVVVDSIFNMGPARGLYTVIGVMAEDFWFPTDSTAFWVPLNSARSGGVATMARLKEGVSASAAAEEIGGILQRLRGLDAGATADSGVPRIEIVSLHDEMVASVAPALRALGVAVALLLLIACANVANLLLARNASRQREMAVRVALGAGRARLLRQMTSEGLVLACLGGILGAAFAVAGTRVVRAIFAEIGSFATIRQIGSTGQSVAVPRLQEVGLDLPMFAVAAVTSLVVGLVFGLAPAFRTGAGAHMDALRQGASAVSAGLGRVRRDVMRSALVMAQIALAVVLLLGGGLLVHSFLKLATVDLGYEPDGVLTFQLRMPPGRYTSQTLSEFAEDLVSRLRSVPGARTAGYALSLPMVPMITSTSLRLAPGERLPPPSGSRAASIHHPSVQLVSRTYPQALGMRLVAGRGFAADDGTSVRAGVLINQTLARGRFPGENPVGRQVYFAVEPVEILGVIADVRQEGSDVPPEPQVIADIAAWGTPSMGFTPNLHYLVRTGGSHVDLVPGIREAVRQLDRDALLDNVAPMQQLIASSIARPRTYALLFGAFATVATVLAAIGIYGVMAYAVSQNTRDIGVRMALGADHPQVLRMVLGRAAILTGVGMGVGLAGAVGLSQYLRGMIFGMAPLDAPTYAAVTVMFSLVAVFASYVPARRATQVNPLVALRSE